jgi:L-alanine-DL-glutamate epimerase-like enolase superfamily enzyme
VGLAASLQAAASIPNFLIMEYPVSWEPFANEIARNPLQAENGYIPLPTEPGIGIDLDEGKLAAYPYNGARRRVLLDPSDERP